VIVLSRHLARSCKKAVDAARRVIQYLITTRDFAIEWKSSRQSQQDQSDNVLIGAVERPSGTPDHRRGLHKHRIRGCGPLLMLLSLISYSKLASRHFPRDSPYPICPVAPILGVSTARGSQSPFFTPLHISSALA
jgi:hypothetical protein